jgi:hypothetical protein
VVEGRTYDRSDAGRPIVDYIYVAGYANNGQYHTGLTDQREPAEQRSAMQRLSVADSRHHPVRDDVGDARCAPHISVTIT